MIYKFCKRYEDIFFNELHNLTFSNQIKHSIKTKDDVPIYTKSYRYPYIHREEIRKQISDMLNQGIIRLRNAPSTFQRVMDNVLKDLLGKVCLVYMDDIIVFPTSLQEHLNSLTAVFDKLRIANLKIQLQKSVFLQKEVSFLGHIVTADGVKPNP